MIGLDANVLVRYLVQDDPIQSPKATKLIEHRLTESNQGFVSVVAMIETVWVLRRTYDFSDTRIAGAIEWLLKADVLAIENEREISIAMMALRRGQASFPDALIGALNARAGCHMTVTFDRKAARLPGFVLV